MSRSTSTALQPATLPEDAPLTPTSIYGTANVSGRAKAILGNVSHVHHHYHNRASHSNDATDVTKLGPT